MFIFQHILNQSKTTGLYIISISNKPTRDERGIIDTTSSLHVHLHISQDSNFHAQFFLPLKQHFSRDRRTYAMVVRLPWCVLSWILSDIENLFDVDRSACQICEGEPSLFWVGNSSCMSKLNCKYCKHMACRLNADCMVWEWLIAHTFHLLAPWASWLQNQHVKTDATASQRGRRCTLSGCEEATNISVLPS